MAANGRETTIEDILSLTQGYIYNVIESEEELHALIKILYQINVSGLIHILVFRLEDEANPALRKWLTRTILQDIERGNFYNKDVPLIFSSMLMKIKGVDLNPNPFMRTREETELQKRYMDDFNKIKDLIQKQCAEIDREILEEIVTQIISFLNIAAEQGLIRTAGFANDTGLFPAIFMIAMHVVGDMQYSDNYNSIISKIKLQIDRKPEQERLIKNTSKKFELIRHFNAAIYSARTEAEREIYLQRRREIINEAEEEGIEFSEVQQRIIKLRDLPPVGQTPEEQTRAELKRAEQAREEQAERQEQEREERARMARAELERMERAELVAREMREERAVRARRMRGEVEAQRLRVAQAAQAVQALREARAVHVELDAQAARAARAAREAQELRAAQGAQAAQALRVALAAREARIAREAQGAQAAQAAQAAPQQMDPELAELRRRVEEERRRQERLIEMIRQQQMHNFHRLEQAARLNKKEAERFVDLARDGRLSEENVNLLVDRVVPPIAPPPKPGNGPFPLPDFETEEYRKEDIIDNELRENANALAIDGRMKTFATEMHNNVMCKICLTNKVNRVYVPCGHFICSVCLEQMPSKKCPTCNEPFSTAISVRLMKYLKYKNKYLQLKKKLFNL